MTSTELTTTAPQTVAKSAKKEKKLRLPPRLGEAVRLLETGECKTQRAAAERAGLNERYLSRKLNEVEIRAYLAQRAAENISRGVLRASARYVELIEAQSEHVAARVSERFLEHGGIIKPQQSGGVNVSINNNLAAGYVIDLAPVVDTPSTPQEEKTIIDQEPMR